MSKKELNRLEVMERLKGKSMTHKAAAAALGICERQVKRLWKRYQEKGAAGLVSRRRGKPSNNRLSAETEQAVVNLLHSRYADFGPTLAHEKLVERHGLKLSVGSVRKIMIGEGLWKAKKVRKMDAHQMRERRACFGELVQIDGSPHDWFEGRAPACTLLVFIDDATGQLGQLLFVENESFFSYCRAAEGYFTRYGKPGAFYSDKHGIFRVNQPSAGYTDALTQFGRAMQELDVQIICANTPQAKGRVERAIQTLQDRLPKELRLRGISDWEAGNAYLPEFIADFNQRFAVQPRNTLDAHRPLASHDDLAHIFTWQETRILSKNLTLQFRNRALHGFLRPCDHVITSSMEHNSVMRPLRHLEKRGVAVTVVACSAEGFLNPADVESAIRPNTALIALNHASNVTGTLLPVGEVGEIARSRNLLLLADVAQTAGAYPIDMQADNIDLLAFTGHKALYGPTGTGGLILGACVDESKLTALKQGGTGSRSEYEEQPEFLPDKYESGTPNAVGLAGLGAGLDWIMARGVKSIRQHEMTLGRKLMDGLREISGVTVYGPPDASLRTAVVAFNIAGLPPSEVGQRLDEDYGILCRVGLHCAPSAHRTIGTFPAGTLRLSLGVFNTEKDIEATLTAIHAMLKNR